MTTSEAGPVSGPAFAVPDLGEHAALWIVRHGETEWSASGQHTSTTDLPLTRAGEEQASALRGMLAGLDPVLVLSSPRRRALRTAELAGLTVDELTDDLVEWDYGAYEGRTTHEIRRDAPNWSIWTDGCPGGESFVQIEARADRLLARAAQRLPDGPVVVVGHGHFSRVLGARWLGLPIAAGAHLLLGTAAPSVLGAQYGATAIVHWNLPNPATRTED